MKVHSMQRRSELTLLALLLGLLTSCLTASAVPLTPALNRRQDLSTLNIDAGKPGPVYRTNAAVNCSTYDLKLTGQPAAGSTPFLVDAIRAPYNPRLPSSQEVLVRVGSYANLTTVQWADDVPAGERFIFRLTDAHGNVRYSTEKISEEGAKGKKGCRQWGPTIFERYKAAFVVCGIVGGAFLVGLIAWAFDYLSARAQEGGAGPAAAPRQGAAQRPLAPMQERELAPMVAVARAGGTEVAAAPVRPLLAAAQDAPPTRPPSYDSVAK